MRYFFGVDVGGTTVKVGMFKEDGELVSKYELPTRKENNGEYILKDIADSIKETLDKSGTDCTELLGIGIGVPGPVTDDGTVLNCVNLGWGIVNVPEKMKELIPVACKAGNDANMAALGEMYKGGAKGYENVVLATLGTGVGGGIIIGGRMINGANGAGGEIGHMPVSDDLDMPLCNCGKRGCLEQYASATGIVNTTKRLLKSVDKASKLRDINSFSAKDVFDLAKEGDGVAIEAIEVLGKYLGTAFAHISCVIDPQVFVIGGGVSKAGEILVEATSKYYVDKAFNPSKNTKITLATLGNDAGIYGALKLIMG